MTAEILEWLEGRESSRPFFLFANYIEPHWKYDPPARWTEQVAPGWAPRDRDAANFPLPRWYLRRDRVEPGDVADRAVLYDAELAYADAILAELVAGLDRLGVLERCLLVVTSDHGENLGDHGHVGHAFSLYESTLHVPLLVRPPGGVAGGEIRRNPVQLTDVFGTLLAAAGAAAAPPDEAAHDLLAGEAPVGRPVLAEYYRPEQVFGFFPDRAGVEEAVAPFDRRIRSLLVGSEKLIWGSDGRHELYDLAADPDETTDLAGERPERVAALADELEGVLVRLAARAAPRPDSADAASAAPDTLDPDLRERLRALGYVR